MRRILVVLMTAGLLLGGLAPAAGAATGDGKHYYLSNALRGGEADETFAYGRADDAVFVGDWNADGVDTLGVRRGARYYLSNSFQGGDADVVFTYGRDDDEVFLGDWDGDGVDTLAVRRGRTFYVTNGLRGGNAEDVFVYGRLGDVVLVGDWDGDGDDTFAVRRGRTYYVANRLRGGEADVTFDYGRPDDLVYVGDWDGDGDDTLGVRRNATYYLSNTLRGGNADSVFTYGRSTDVTLVGDWDGVGGDTLGVRRVDAPVSVAQDEQAVLDHLSRWSDSSYRPGGESDGYYTPNYFFFTSNNNYPGADSTPGSCAYAAGGPYDYYTVEISPVPGSVRPTPNWINPETGELPPGRVYEVTAWISGAYRLPGQTTTQFYDQGAVTFHVSILESGRTFHFVVCGYDV